MRTIAPPASLRSRIVALVAILAIPILGLTALVVESEHGKARVLTRELEGMRVLEPHQKIFSLLMRHHNAIDMQLHDGPSYAAKVNDYSAGIDAAFSRAEILALNQGRPESFRTELLRMKTDWNRIKSRELSVREAEYDNLYRKALADAGEMIAVVGDEFGLMEDADKATYNLITILVNDWPDQMHDLGVIRNLGIDLLSGHIPRNEAERVLENAAADFARASRSADRALGTAALADPALGAPHTGIEKMGPATNSLLVDVRMNLLGGSDRITLHSWNNKMSDHRARLDAYAVVIQNAVAERLSRRLAESHTRSFGLLIGVVVILTVIGMWAAQLVISTGRKVEALVTATEALGSGRLTYRYHPQGIQELDRLGSAFNAMAGSLERTFTYINRSDSLIKNIFDYAPTMIIVKDSDLRWTMVNRGAADRLQTVFQKDVGYFIGRTDDELGLDMSLLYGAIDGRPADDPSVEFRAMESGLVRLESTAELPSGRRFLRLEAAAQRDDSGRVHGVVLNIRDITDQKELEARQRELEAQMQQRQKLETVGTLASGIAHDFNNILGVVMLNADMLSDHVAEKGRQSLERVKVAAKRAREIVRKMLTFARRVEYDPTDMTFSDVLQEAVPLIAAAASPNVQITQDIEDPCPVIHADRTHMLQVILNLGLNSVYAMGSAGGTLAFKVDTWTVQAGDDTLPPGTYARLTVSDTGPGIPEEIVSRVFDPFFTTKPPGEGSGLGLSTALGILESHGGILRIEPNPDGGTIASALIPSVRGKETVHDAGTDARALRPGTKVLFVDDDDEYRVAMSQTLQALGCRVTECSTPAGALEWIARGGECQVALLDYSMPGLNGLDLLREIRKARPLLPALISSGRLDSPRNVKGLPHVQFLGKPCSANEIHDALLQLLNAS